MNLNNLLCKYLDKDGRGYVTAGNLVTVVSALATILIICAGYVRGATLLIEDNYCDTGLFDMPILTVGVIDSVCIAITTVITGLVFTGFLALVLTRILIAVSAVWGAEIATCEREEDEQHE